MYTHMQEKVVTNGFNLLRKFWCESLGQCIPNSAPGHPGEHGELTEVLWRFYTFLRKAQQYLTPVGHHMNLSLSSVDAKSHSMPCNIISSS